MALPKLESPKYSVEIPSTKKKVTFRPFLVKEEKILMMINESDDSQEMIRAMKDVISACTFGAVKPGKLTTYDLETLFLAIRAKSVGETSIVTFECDNCSAENKVKINLDQAKTVIKPTSENGAKIMLTEDVGLIMRHLTVADMEKISETSGLTDGKLMTELLARSIESIFDADAVYPSSETPGDEMDEFIDSLSHSQLEQIQQFISDAPKLEYVVKYTCSECGHVHDFTLSGVQSFFE